MTDRREFLRYATNALGVAPMLALAERVHLEDASRGQGVSPDQIARDERFWANIRGAYTLNEHVVNLDHGWTNPAPTAAVDELVDRKSVVKGKSVDLGGRRIIKKKT